MYKFNFELVPNSLKQMFVVNKSIHTHNTGQRNCSHTCTVKQLIYIIEHLHFRVYNIICRILS